MSSKTCQFCAIFALFFATSYGQDFFDYGGRKSFENQRAEDKIPNGHIQNWAMSFGTVLWETARMATQFDAVTQAFRDKGATVQKVDGFTMVTNMAAKVEAMMRDKIDAVQRIMDFGENLALNHKYDPGMETKDFHYFNAKRLNVLSDPEDDLDTLDNYLAAHDRRQSDAKYAEGYSRLGLDEGSIGGRFGGIPVNASRSVVHLPTYVYEGDPKVINAIKWSEGLDSVFLENADRDPSLLWQFFGSASGFLRQYPAVKWMESENEEDQYDARMRQWYIKSAASPKELIILLDTSGSMTGLRKEIAKHVVDNILETLGENDYLSIYTFAEKPKPLFKCSKLIQVMKKAFTEGRLFSAHFELLIIDPLLCLFNKVPFEIAFTEGRLFSAHFELLVIEP